MRAIAKGPEPASLMRHRLTPHCDYDNYADKDALRDALVSEQRELCCYCMGRIRNNAMKVEHWKCQSRYPEEQLNYRNLLGACWGGEGQPQGLQHCDTRKGDKDLRWNPANARHRIETRLRYTADGSIRSDDMEFDDELNEVLNLNLQILKNNRKSVLDAILEWLNQEKRRAQGRVPRARIQRELDRLTRHAGELVPYCQVAVWWLEYLKGSST